ncbi:hypothetical protein MYX07_01545 [Patescibacteria group bacterium AH-259-L07]|nr:hypothetical protein [Patescibacteria group bacterium AH-259-L07]
MKSETKTCQNCKQKFVIEPDDFTFYKKIKVPAPTFCPECRRQRRLSWRNDIHLYHHTCGLCGKSIVSIFAPDSPMTIYCNKCWWSDKWDARDYGKDIDFSKPFFEQFRGLQNAVPALALINDNDIASVNCEYTQDVAFSKNCYMLFIAWKMENCLYSRYGAQGKDIMDTETVAGACQFVYDSIFINKCYHCRNIYWSTALVDCAFCYDCRGCSNCFMSFGLRHKQYCFKNKQYTKEEYEKIIADYRLHAWTGVQRAKQEFENMIQQYPRRFANLWHCVNCTGNDMLHCKNMKDSFNVWKGENCRYFENGDGPKDSYDISIGGEHNQCYESITPDHSYRNLFTIFSWKNSEITYCENCHSSKYLFGCSGIKKGEYCILNKQYTKKEYNIFRKKLITHMKDAGEWGEFFPGSLSHFGYNETVAQDYYPLRKRETIARGLRWRDKLQFTTGKETIRFQDVPDSIDEVQEKIINEIFSCEQCARNFKIVPQEYMFYKKMRIPIPRRCFYCRQAERIHFRTPSRLWHRTCQCAGEKSGNKVYQNTIKHFHGTNHCPNGFETSYAPKRKEIVYCEKCYQQEVV